MSAHNKNPYGNGQNNQPHNNGGQPDNPFSQGGPQQGGHPQGGQGNQAHNPFAQGNPQHNGGGNPGGNDTFGANNSGAYGASPQNGAPHNGCQNGQFPQPNGNPYGTPANGQGQPGQAGPQGQPGQAGQQGFPGQPHDAAAGAAGAAGFDSQNQYGSNQYGAAGNGAGQEKKSKMPLVLAALAALALIIGGAFAVSSMGGDEDTTNTAAESDETTGAEETTGASESSEASETSDSATSSSETSTSIPGSRAATGQIRVGDCFSQPGQTEYNPAMTAFQETDCGSDDAVLKALAEKKRPSDTDCIDTPGSVTTALNSNGNLICMGEAKVDPDTTVLAARAGDCIVEGNSESNVFDVKKTDCNTPNAYKIITTLDDAPNQADFDPNTSAQFCVDKGIDSTTAIYVVYLPIMTENGKEDDKKSWCMKQA